MNLDLQRQALQALDPAKALSTLQSATTFRSELTKGIESETAFQKSIQDLTGAVKTDEVLQRLKELTELKALLEKELKGYKDLVTASQEKLTDLDGVIEGHTRAVKAALTMAMEVDKLIGESTDFMRTNKRTFESFQKK